MSERGISSRIKAIVHQIEPLPYQEVSICCEDPVLSHLTMVVEESLILEWYGWGIKPEVSEWCLDNLLGSVSFEFHRAGPIDDLTAHFVIKPYGIFENERDMVMFRLRWG